MLGPGHMTSYVEHSEDKTTWEAGPRLGPGSAWTVLCGPVGAWLSGSQQLQS